MKEDPFAVRYACFVNELDAQLPVEPGELLASACKSLRRVRLLIKALSDKEPDDQNVGEPVNGRIDRPVSAASVIPLACQLGEINRRIEVAVHSAEAALRLERSQIHAARREVKQVKRAEKLRIRQEVLIHQLAKRSAMTKLFALSTEKARVVRVNTYTKNISPASWTEATQYTNGLRRLVLSSPTIRPVSAPSVAELYNPSEFRTVNLQLGILKELSRLIDTELGYIANAHTSQLQRVLTNGSDEQRVLAISSLGWWNGLQGWKWANEALVAESDRMRDAARGSLERLRLSRSSLLACARHCDERVRMKAIEIAADYVHQLGTMQDVLILLTKDDSNAIRKKANERLRHACDAGVLRTNDTQRTRGRRSFAKLRCGP